MNDHHTMISLIGGARRARTMGGVHTTEDPIEVQALAAFDRLTSPINGLLQECGRLEKLLRMSRAGAHGESRNARRRCAEILQRRGWSSGSGRATGPWEYVLAFTPPHVRSWDSDRGELWAALIAVLARRVGLRSAPLLRDPDAIYDDVLPDAIYLRGPRLVLGLYLDIVQGLLVPLGEGIAHRILLQLVHSAPQDGTPSPGAPPPPPTPQPTGPPAGQDMSDPGPPSVPPVDHVDDDDPLPHAPRTPHIVLEDETPLHPMSLGEAASWLASIIIDAQWAHRAWMVDPTNLTLAAFLQPVDVLHEPIGDRLCGLALVHQGPYDPARRPQGDLGGP